MKKIKQTISKITPIRLIANSTPFDLFSPFIPLTIALQIIINVTLIGRFQHITFFNYRNKYIRYPYANNVILILFDNYEMPILRPQIVSKNSNSVLLLVQKLDYRSSRFLFE